MEQVLRIIAEYQWWIYGLFGLILLFYLWRALAARREEARSIFKLEQEQARARYGQSVVMSALVLVIIAAVFGTSAFLLPEIDRPPDQGPTPTVTSGLLVEATLTFTPLPPTSTPTATATPVPLTRPVRPTATSEVIATEPPAVRAPNCPNPDVRLTSPGVNQVVQGNVAIRGTASIPNFQYYKIEVGPGTNPKDSEWTVVGQLRHTAVSNGLLETFNSAAYPPGTYTLRLVVVDQTGNYPDPCRVTITIQR
jgi:hypothetical protein